MRRVLIISPYFPPTNAADMQRVRMSIPYFSANGWTPEIVTIDPCFSDMGTDPLLQQSIPEGVPVHYVKALSKKWTSRIGLGSIALRSLYHYRIKVNELLKGKRFDLIYFSTTQFPVCILGAYWKKRFGIPYVIDMQDPWLSDFYRDKPKSQRPPKYWFSYRLNKLLEPRAMKRVDGLISVSPAYLETLRSRYPNCRTVPQQTITFGAFDRDLEIAAQNRRQYGSVLEKAGNRIHIAYIGRGGRDMEAAVTPLFRVMRKCLDEDPVTFSRLHFWFIGTSYATAGKGVPTIQPVAEREGVGPQVTEQTGRIPFYQALNTLLDADAVFIPGSNDPAYTASKIYPYVQVRKPLLAFFHPASSVVSFLQGAGVGTVLTFDQDPVIVERCIREFLRKLLNGASFSVEPDARLFSQYSAEAMTRKQCALFNQIVS